MMDANAFTKYYEEKLKRGGSEIIPNFLFLGSGSDAKNVGFLQRSGIKHIVNVADDVPNYLEKSLEVDITYCNLNVSDFGEDKGISRVFDTAFRFLSEQEEKKNPVLVHCAAGVNRSPTIVIAYLMHSRGWSLIETYDYVRKKRLAVSPLKDNKKQLMEYEIATRGTSSFESEQAFYKI